jgi:AcrR family transcriptional regulator
MMEMPTSKTTPTPKHRPRDAAATRQAILEAAQILFTEHGYEQCNLRQIAAQAGVDVALVNRYFGSKRGLFAAIFTEDGFSFEPFMALGRTAFAEALARHAVGKVKEDCRFDPLIIAMQSASSADARQILNRMLESKLTGPLAKWLGGKDAHLRASMIIAWLTGFDLMRNILRAEPLSRAESEKLIKQLTAAIKSAM